MKIPHEISVSLLSIFMTAQARGWLDVKSLEPVLKLAVENGYADDVRRMLFETIALLDNVERNK